MAQVSQRTGFTGSALTRLLAQLTELDVPESEKAFADRLSDWLSWTDAILLSSAMNGATAASSGARGAASSVEAEYTRVRAALTGAIGADGATAGDFPSYRRRYLARQQAMEAGIGPLRAKLRARLAAGSPGMARLAALDAVMEQVLGGHEQRLLATVPALLEKHFERLRQPDSEAPPEGWQDLFGRNMQGVLLAELDIRLQPVEGLLEALRKRS